MTRFVAAACGFVRRFAAFGSVYLTVSMMLNAQSGSIAGIVQGQDGTPITNATVVAARRFTSTQTTAPALSFTTTDHSGKYEFANVIQGSYVVCAQVAWMSYLDPCAWDIPPAVNLQASQQAALNLTLKTGVFLHVRVDDPIAALKKQKAKTGSPVYLMQVLDRRGSSHAIQQVALDAGGENLRTVVPPDTDVQLVIIPGAIALHDDQDQSVSTGQSYTFHIGAQEHERTIRFTAKDQGK